MGGICVKPSGGSPRDKRTSKLLSESHGSQSTREDSFRVKTRAEVRTGSIDKRLNSSRRVRDDHFDKKKEVSGVVTNNNLSIEKLPKAIEGEQVVAGWPSWLANVAGEAIRGWLPRRADSFEKLDKIGQGTYSHVYKARDLINNKIVALKRVRFDNMDLDSVKFMAREILILRKLNHPNIIKLEGLITSRSSCSIYLVFEYMEHDLTGLSSLPGVKFTEPQVKCYMKQLLSGLDHCHSHNVLHRDIKGSNLLIDNNGILKIADFGLANFFDKRGNVPLTNRVVTLWYRPPELLLGASHYGVGIDLWSAGCILGELYAGKPIMPGRTEVEQMHRIFKLCGSPADDYWIKSKLPDKTAFKPIQPYKRRIRDAFKEFPSPAIGLMETLLTIDPDRRGTAALALKSEFFTSKPHACDPASLPHYPPSKEIDAKMREVEARRQRAAAVGSNGQHVDNESRGSKESRAVAAPDANAELVTSIQRRQDRGSSQSRSELFSKYKEESTSEFRIEKLKDASKDVQERGPPMRESYSGPLNSAKKHGEISMIEDQEKEILMELTKDRMGKLSESAQEFTRTRNQRHMESANNNKEPMMNNQGYIKGNKIQFSGPLASSNVDQMLKDHDRQIQEAARRTRMERARVNKVEIEGMQMARNAVYPSIRLAK